MTPLDRLLLTLPDVKPAGKGWSARCPAHEDRRASLSIAEGEDGRVLVKCHAGCKVDAICRAVGLRVVDLMPTADTLPVNSVSVNGNRRSTRKAALPLKPKGKPATKTFATACDAVAELERRHGPRSALWTYHDAHGEPVGVVVRWNLADGKKDIRPVSRHSDGWRIGGMPEPRPLYCLPELAGANRVYVCEGEKAADAIRALGLVATTSPHGCESPGKADWRPLAGKEIVRLPDNDSSGGKYANAVAALLAKLTPVPVVKVVELPDLPDRGDAVDFVAARATTSTDELRQIVEALADNAEPLAATRQAAPGVRDAQAGEKDADDAPILADDPWPDPLASEAFHGVVGEVVRIIEPHSEADPVALLIQLLAGFGNLIGRTAYFTAEADRHYGNLFACLVGTTSKGRKGTSWGQVQRILRLVDENWTTDCHFSGLSTGEGLIWAVRDEITRQVPVKEKGRIVDYETEVTDSGVADKRAMVQESEFSAVLKVASRERNTISNILRQAWETGNLRTMTKNSPARATGAHVSIVGHVTRQELRQQIAEVDLANGLANRFLWTCVEKSKSLPEGGNLRDAELHEVVARLQAAVEFARSVERIVRDENAREIWAAVYPDLSAGKPGLLGAATGRAEAQTMRLAMLYALLDSSRTIRSEHLTAALAVWTYCEQSARYIFGSALGNAVADAILDELRRQPGGMTRTEIREYFQRNKSSDEIAVALQLLLDCRMVRTEQDKSTGGRSAERWYAL